MSTACPTLLVAAPASGQGKTSVTAAIARSHLRAGRRVRVFKIGPDFIDPLLHERASGHAALQLDLWMNGEDEVRARLHAAAGEADLILVEGVMGLFDGRPSSADLAARFDLPVLLVIDANAMAQTFGAIAQGLARHRAGLRVHGVVANRVAGEYHAQLLRESLPADLPWRGFLPAAPEFALPERHLGLTVASEIGDVDLRLDALAAAWTAHGSDALPPPACFAAALAAPVPRSLVGCRIAIARDAAFCFLYPANLELLHAAGAQLVFFSPLAGDALPACDAVWLPGGYPELHLAGLAVNTGLHRALAAHVAAGKPLLAECGGLLFTLDALADHAGQVAPMAGLLRGTARLQPRPVALGLQQARLPEGLLRGHSFHCARADIGAEPLLFAATPDGSPGREAVYRRGRFTASFVHWYFPSNPAAAVALLRP